MGDVTSFILIAAMRTGSNFLEANLRQIPGLTCWGEAFNPHFVGSAGRKQLAGVTLAEREADPARLLDALAGASDGIPGFRFFPGHDPRVLDRCLADRSCAKIILTRNPLDSFVSLEIARATRQWRLKEGAEKRSARVAFDPDAFAAYLDRHAEFRSGIDRALKESGQAAFRLSYEEAGDPAVLNGIARFLGLEARVERFETRSRVQNPEALSERVTNYEEMLAALGRLDRFGLERMAETPRPRPEAPVRFVAPPRTPLVYLPVAGGPSGRIRAWLAALDGIRPKDLETGEDRTALGEWTAARPGHLAFTVLRSPARRVHSVFCHHLLNPEGGRFREILRESFGVPLPDGPPGPDWDLAAHRQAFAAFLDVAEANLAGRTSMGVDPALAEQSERLRAISDRRAPDLVLREEELETALPALAARMGREARYEPAPPERPFPLSDVLDEALSARIAAIYARDIALYGLS
ncbi:hypothetical protein LX81_00709 [Palleronia aestuarii]|uniref:LPS sulfotransferase NodH n=1 Tax=Palleronia aestuarii TaxID=568105 RepID=A0A2W7NF07_9RHOB|nr:nodulation protein NodH [Palleronia aestuarii]PZX19015.1 hypothetical protein LX81_00709 [Palleronia aestuarii]